MQPVIALLIFLGMFAQNASETPKSQGAAAYVPIGAGTNSTSEMDYHIGPEDLIDISVFDVPALAGGYKVSGAGIISLPLIGDVIVAGKTPREVSDRIESLLKPNFVNDPHVNVSVREYASQPVSVLGAVKLPGIYQIKGKKSLLDIIALAQGLSLDAGQTIQIIRRTELPPGQITAPGTPASSTIVIETEDLFTNGKAEVNIPVQAGDIVNVLTAPPAQSIFIVGEMLKPGEYPQRAGKVITLTQAMALGGGFTHEAKKSECVIIRYRPDRTREDIPVDMPQVLKGSAPDLPLMPNDILYIPATKTKAGFSRALDSVIAVAMGRAIYLGH